ncbi:hypothetical protein Trydic_g9512 [Trypoxylus dichotomus]
MYQFTGNQGNVIIYKQDKIKTWVIYITKLFQDARPQHPRGTDELWPVVTPEEIQFAVQQMKEGRASGPDNHRPEILKLLDESVIIQMRDMFNCIYETG